MHVGNSASQTTDGTAATVTGYVTNFNQKLSQRRAQSCVDYLVSKGIPSERMKAVGYGETIPRMKGLECETISNLSTNEEQEAAHQKNRRTQFIVLNFDYGSKDN